MQLANLNFRHRFVPSAPGNERTLLLLHGTGGNENDLLDIGKTLDPTAVLLSPRGKVLENGMPRFFRRLEEGVFDEEDLVHRTHELADFVLAASREYQFDEKDIVAVGYSNGANIAAAMLLLRPEVLSGAVLLRPMVPLIPENLPSLNGKQIYVASGAHDSLIPADNAQELVTLLQEAGAQVTFALHNAGHGLVGADIEEARQWLEKF